MHKPALPRSLARALSAAQLPAGTRRLTAIAVAAGLLATGLAACGAGQAAPAPAASSQPSGGSGNSAGRQPPASDPPLAPGSLVLQSTPRRVKAKGGALFDPATSQLLWSRQLDTERPMGSITKVMTALLVIEAGDLNRKIRIPRAALRYVVKYQAESGGLHPGDVLTSRQLLEAMLLASACDAAYVLATTYGPGMPAFLAKMNATAAKLGMARTRFTSPDGLPYPTEYSTYSTPADLLKLGTAAMKLPVFRSIVSQSFFHLAKSKGHHHAYWWDNTNGLIGNYRGAIGIKDGYTDKARHCLLFEARRAGRTLIGVVLGSPVTGPYAAAQAAERLLNWGFGLKTIPSSS